MTDPAVSPSDLRALADRCEAADGPSREIDGEIARLLLPGEKWPLPSGSMPGSPAQPWPHWTRSLDACRNLHARLLGREWDYYVFTDCGACFARLMRHGEDGWEHVQPATDSASSELAWLRAIILVMAGEKPRLSYANLRGEHAAP